MGGEPKKATSIFDKVGDVPTVPVKSGGSIFDQVMDVPTVPVKSGGSVFNQVGDQVTSGDTEVSSDLENKLRSLNDMQVTAWLPALKQSVDFLNKENYEGLSELITKIATEANSKNTGALVNHMKEIVEIRKDYGVAVSTATANAKTELILSEDSLNPTITKILENLEAFEVSGAKTRSQFQLLCQKSITLIKEDRSMDRADKSRAIAMIRGVFEYSNAMKLDENGVLVLPEIEAEMDGIQNKIATMKFPGEITMFGVEDEYQNETEALKALEAIKIHIGSKDFIDSVWDDMINFLGETVPWFIKGEKYALEVFKKGFEKGEDYDRYGEDAKQWAVWGATAVGSLAFTAVHVAVVYSAIRNPKDFIVKVTGIGRYQDLSAEDRTKLSGDTDPNSPKGIVANRMDAINEHKLMLKQFSVGSAEYYAYELGIKKLESLKLIPGPSFAYKSVKLGKWKRLHTLRSLVPLEFWKPGAWKNSLPISLIQHPVQHLGGLLSSAKSIMVNDAGVPLTHLRVNTADYDIQHTRITMVDKKLLPEINKAAQFLFSNISEIKFSSLEDKLEFAFTGGSAVPSQNIDFIRNYIIANTPNAGTRDRHLNALTSLINRYQAEPSKTFDVLMHEIKVEVFDGQRVNILNVVKKGEAGIARNKVQIEFLYENGDTTKPGKFLQGMNNYVDYLIPNSQELITRGQIDTYLQNVTRGIEIPGSLDALVNEIGRHIGMTGVSPQDIVRNLEKLEGLGGEDFKKYLESKSLTAGSSALTDNLLKNQLEIIDATNPRNSMRTQINAFESSVLGGNKYTTHQAFSILSDIVFHGEDFTRIEDKYSTAASANPADRLSMNSFEKGLELHIAQAIADKRATVEEIKHIVEMPDGKIDTKYGLSNQFVSRELSATLAEVPPDSTHGRSGGSTGETIPSPESETRTPETATPETAEVPKTLEELKAEHTKLNKQIKTASTTVQNLQSTYNTNHTDVNLDALTKANTDLQALKSQEANLTAEIKVITDKTKAEEKVVADKKAADAERVALEKANAIETGSAETQKVRAFIRDRLSTKANFIQYQETSPGKFEIMAFDKNNQINVITLDTVDTATSKFLLTEYITKSLETLTKEGGIFRKRFGKKITKLPPEITGEKKSPKDIFLKIKEAALAFDKVNSTTAANLVNIVDGESKGDFKTAEFMRDALKRISGEFDTKTNGAIKEIKYGNSGIEITTGRYEIHFGNTPATFNSLVEKIAEIEKKVTEHEKASATNKPALAVQITELADTFKAITGHEAVKVRGGLSYLEELRKRLKK